MAWDTNTADYLAAPSGKPVMAGNDVMVFGSALPAELLSYGYAAAFVTYHSAYDKTKTTRQVKYFFTALYRSGGVAAVDFGAVMVANAASSEVGTVVAVQSTYMDTTRFLLETGLGNHSTYDDAAYVYLGKGARVNNLGFVELVGGQSGWRGLINFTNSYASSDHQVKRLSSGQVVMRGLLSTLPTSPVNGQKIADLPASFLYPSAPITVPVRTGTTAGVTGLAISSAGVITLDSGSSAAPSGYMYLNATWSAT